ncbi:MAG: hypothetical protein HS104_11725 [Polyangiaceae bacterium]|nr:hypothetical protein [Polyangiaceae bacterium]MCL4748552.1 hypothetical protein [Myxococcales bacterium]
MTPRQLRAAEKKVQKNLRKKMSEHLAKHARGSSIAQDQFPVTAESEGIRRRAAFAFKFLRSVGYGNRHCAAASELGQQIFASVNGAKVVAYVHCYDFARCLPKFLGPDSYLAANHISVDGPPDRPDQLNAHMLLRVGQHYYVDLTASQFDPTFPEPLVLHCEDENPTKLRYKHGETTLLYVFRPGDRQFEEHLSRVQSNRDPDAPVLLVFADDQP